MFFFFKQKTAYEMRISDWSSDVCSSDLGKPFASVAVDEQARLAYLLKREYRQNTYDEATGTVTVTDRRAQAMADTGTWYQRLYGNDPELRQTRDNYAMKENRSEEHTSELQSLMRISYAVFCLNKK